MLKNEDVVDFFFFVYFNILLQLYNDKQVSFETNM